MSAHSFKDKKNTTRFVDMVDGLRRELAGETRLGPEEKKKARIAQMEEFHALQREVGLAIERLKANPKSQLLKESAERKKADLSAYIEAHPLIQERIQEDKEIEEYHKLLGAFNELLKKLRAKPQNEALKEEVKAKREELDEFVKFHPTVGDYLDRKAKRQAEEARRIKANNLVHERRNTLSLTAKAKDEKAKARAEAGIVKAMASIQAQRALEAERALAKAKAEEEARIAEAKAKEEAKVELIKDLNKVLGGYGYKG